MQCMLALQPGILEFQVWISYIMKGDWIDHRKNHRVKEQKHQNYKNFQKLNLQRFRARVEFFYFILVARNWELSLVSIKTVTSKHVFNRQFSWLNVGVAGAGRVWASGASWFPRKGTEARGRQISLNSFSFVGYPFLAPSSLAVRDITLLLGPSFVASFFFSSACLNIRIYSLTSITAL